MVGIYLSDLPIKLRREPGIDAFAVYQRSLGISLV